MRGVVALVEHPKIDRESQPHAMGMQVVYSTVKTERGKEIVKHIGSSVFGPN